LEPDLVSAADALVDRSAIRNRSHALEHLVKEGLGLHLLRQAFFFLGDGWGQDQAERVAALCHTQGIVRSYLCASAGQESQRGDLRAVLGRRAPEMASEDVPLDFGSGGAVLLRQAELEHPFLLVWLGADLRLPASLVGAYAAHRRLNHTVTQLIAGDGRRYAEAGLAIASPALPGHIPAGIVSLQAAVFPELLKTGTLGTYAFHV